MLAMAVDLLFEEGDLACEQMNEDDLVSAFDFDAFLSFIFMQSFFVLCVPLLDLCSLVGRSMNACETRSEVSSGE